MKFKQKTLLRVSVATLLSLSSIGLNAQNITKDFKGESLRDVLKAVEKQTGMSVIYKVGEVNANKKITASFKSTPLDKVLQTILDAGVSYEINNNIIAIHKKENEKQDVKRTPQSGRNKTVKGTVLDERGEPIIGATIKVKDTKTATVTDIDGNFTLDVPEGSKLVISYLGYADKEVNADSKDLTINMSENSEVLDEVVVTALGIKRSEKALSYNVQKVGGEKVTAVKNTNFMNSLAGKVAGVNINASAAGMGGATKVVMRGPKSITQGNGALYVVDGMPLNNTSHGAVSGIMSTQPGSEGIADINPEDIEDISVLSGPAAAALYGSAAAQGVIMITTKKGQEGKVSVNISHSSQFSNPFVMPKFQTEYINRPNQVSTWGDKRASDYGVYNPKDFFNTGTNIQNNVALTMGSGKNQTYLSVGSTNAKGIIPNNKYDRYNFTFRNTTNFLDDKLTLDFGLNYIRENDRNLMAQGQFYNPLTSVYLFPRGENFDAIRTYELYDEVRGIYTQNWNYGDALRMQNPYWVTHRMNRTNAKSRYMANASLKYQATKWLDVTGRVRWDDAAAKGENKFNASTTDLFAHSKYGFYGYNKVNDQSLYGDLMANINKSWETFSVGANIGGSFSRTKYDVTGYQGGLKAPSNVFTPNAIDYGQVTNDNRPIFDLSKHYINSLFANVELGWKSMLYLTLTGRNDWDSALDGTARSSFFYPSVGMSAVVSQMAKMPQFVNYLKVRASWASVGSAIAPNISSAYRYAYSAASATYQSVTYKFPDTFYPERTDSWEAGLSARLFNNALTVDLTLYHSNTKKQTFLLDIPSAGGYNKEYVQTGNVRNRGLELSVGYNKSWGSFSWSPTLTYSMNRNKVIELFNDPTRTLSMGGLSGIEIILKKGGTMGDIYTTNDFLRDADGNIAISNNKVSQTKLDNPIYRGSVLPKGNLGFANEFHYKGINLGFVLSARFGGIVMSQTQAIMDAYGVSQATAIARNNGGIAVNRGYISAEDYYQVVGGDNPIWSEYIYSATNARLQELHLNYTLPKKWVGKTQVTVGFVAHNLLMLYNKAPFDPESVASTGTYYQGFDYFMQPSLRSIGLNLNVKF